MANGGRVLVELPQRESHPLASLGMRMALAFGLTAFVALIAYLDRDGYADADGSAVTLLDAIYYATVSITTTGYGDVRPESDSARLLTTIFVTPARILFLILLVGTTVELLTARTREAYRLERWRRRLRDHVIVCGYGTKGRAAVSTLLSRGTAPDQIVVIDQDPDARHEAHASGVSAIAGDATRTEVLQAAGVSDARSIVVASDRDDTAVLVTLTARELNPTASIVSAVREEENAHLLRQSGADSVIVSSGAAGRLLGIATTAPQLVTVLEDLMSVGEGLDIVEHPIGAADAGPLDRHAGHGPVLAVIRDGDTLRFDDPRAATLEEGDVVLELRSQGNGTGG
jgi:voltage-gated potassium channel